MTAIQSCNKEVVVFLSFYQIYFIIYRLAIVFDCEEGHKGEAGRVEIGHAQRGPETVLGPGWKIPGCGFGLLRQAAPQHDHHSGSSCFTIGLEGKGLTWYIRYGFKH